MNVGRCGVSSLRLLSLLFIFLLLFHFSYIAGYQTKALLI